MQEKGNPRVGVMTVIRFLAVAAPSRPPGLHFYVAFYCRTPDIMASSAWIAPVHSAGLRFLRNAARDRRFGEILRDPLHSLGDLLVEKERNQPQRFIESRGYSSAS